MTRNEIVEKLTDHYTQAYQHYRSAVLYGTRVASKAEKAKVQRQETDLKEGVPGFTFDMDAGLRPLLWIAINLAFPKGGKRGQPMMLSDWQAWDTIVLFGWVKRDNPRVRRFTDAFIEVARKNGKSTYVGALLDYLAFGEVDGVSCYIGATSLDQAGETFRRAADSLKLRKGDKVIVSDSKNNKQIKYKDSEITAIAAEPKDGKLSYAAVIDEYHQHKDNGLLNSISSGNVSEQQAMLIRITTAGVSLGGVCHEEYKKCKRVLKGELEIPRYFISIYELDEKDSVDDPSVWPKANPNWGVSVDPETFESHYEYARASEDDIIDFKTKNLNLWVDAPDVWIKDDLVARCDYGTTDADLEGETCYAGLDLASHVDINALCLYFPERPVPACRFYFWIPEDKVREKEDRVDYRQWKEEGWIRVTNGNVIDIDEMVADLTRILRRYDVQSLAFDPAKAYHGVIQGLQKEGFDDLLDEFSQGIQNMSEPTKKIEADVSAGLVDLMRNPVIRWMFRNVVIYRDANDNIKMDKKRSIEKIDGCVAMANAYGTYMSTDIDSFHNIGPAYINL